MWSAGCLAVVAVLNVVPVIVTFRPERAIALYGLAPSVLADPVTRVLLRHRGVLFGVLSAWLGASAYVVELRPWAIGAALASKVAFLALCAGERNARMALRRVAAADVIAIGLLVAAVLT
jgi:hypothetical protein